MSIRTFVRRYRFFYKSNSREAYRNAFYNYASALWFPFFGNGTFLPRNGMKPVHVPRKRWGSLATAARLVLMGAYPKWDDKALRIEYKGRNFVQPPWERWTPQGIFVDDVWRLKERNLDGKVVIDIGAFIGDSSIAYAERGAVVHAFEAVPLYAEYLEKNVLMNKLSDRIVVHPVALSNRDNVIRDVGLIQSIASMSHNCLPEDESPSQEVRLVNAINYMRAHGIDKADIIKMNCEGCEYELLKGSELLDYLKPAEAAIDYHHGPDQIFDVLRASGYEVEGGRPAENRGTMFARRRTS